MPAIRYRPALGVISRIIQHARRFDHMTGQSGYIQQADASPGKALECKPGADLAQTRVG